MNESVIKWIDASLALGEGSHSVTSWPTRMYLLAKIDEEPLTPGQIAKLLHCSTANATLQTTTLENMGWVSRYLHSTDRRSWQFTTTPNGKDVLEKFSQLLKTTP